MVPDLSLIQGTISGLKSAHDIAKGMIELKSISDVRAKVIELQGAILDAQSTAFAANSNQAAMVEEIRQLKEEVARMKAWDTEKQRYQLTSLWQGAVAYALKESMSNSEPPHWICTNCYEVGRKSILNQVPDKDRWFVLVCPVCKSQIRTPYAGPAEITFADG